MRGLVALPVCAPLAKRPVRRGSLSNLQQRRQQQQQQHAAPQRQRCGQRLQPAAALPEALAALEVSPARDVAAAAFAVAGSVALIKFFDTLERHNLIDKVGTGCLCSALPKDALLLVAWTGRARPAGRS